MYLFLLLVFISCIRIKSETCRDRFYWPFAINNPFNIPIGSNAIYDHANIFNLSLSHGCDLRTGIALTLRNVCPNWNTSWTVQTCYDNGCCYNPVNTTGIPWCYYPGGRPPRWGIHNDMDIVAISTIDDPMTDWISQGDWNQDAKCAITGKVVTQIPLPVNLSIGCEGGNNAMGLLLPDNRTLIQMQPAYRDILPNSPLLAQYQKGCPVPFPWIIDILSDSPYGAHGGSGLSSIGGTIRSKELSASSPPIRHALKIELFAHDYYFSNGTYAPYNECFRWPALGCDGYAHNINSPLQYNGSKSGLQPGTLLAIPPTKNVSVQSIPAARIRDALIMYGGYIVDDTASDSAAICMEKSVERELFEEYGIELPAYLGTPFYNDLVTIFQSLAIVVNNYNE
jgi:Trefoil (P-type) domain